MFEDIHQALANRNIDFLRSLIKSEEYVDLFRENPWEIMPSFVNTLHTTAGKDDISFHNCIEAVVESTAEKIDSDDVILILVKQMEDIQDDKTFVFLLKLMVNSLLKLLPKDKINYSAWCLNAVQRYLKQLPIPENFVLEDKERLLMDANVTVTRITILYYDILPFYDTLVPAIITLNSSNHKALLLRSILDLFSHPLLYLDMESTDKPKSRARMIAEDLVNKVTQLCCDTFTFFEEDFCNDDNDIPVKQISLSVFFYLHISEQIELEKSLKVYDSIFIFQNSMRFVVSLLTVNHQFVIEKGLKLMSSLLEMISNCSLSYQLLDFDIHCIFCRSIIDIIIYNQSESCRKYSLNIFNNYIYKFDLRGRYLLIYNIAKIVDSTSLRSYIVTRYKHMLAEQFDGNKKLNEYYKGSKLASLIAIFCYLPDGVETDLIKIADEIIAALNLIRYLILRDTANESGIWDNLLQLQNTYLEPLKEALILSKAHYELKLKEIADEGEHEDKSKGASKISVTIEGKGVPALTAMEKVKVINSSITAFDVIDSLLSRLNECIESTRNNMKKM